MRIFKSADGHVLQIADLDKIREWNPELPLIFIGFIREKRLPFYNKTVQKEVSAYLDEILEQVAIPKLTQALYSKNDAQKLIVAQNIATLSESNPDQLQIALPHIEKVIGEEKNKEIVALMQKAKKNYEKAQKRKQTAKKRQQLTELRKKMDKIDDLFAQGKISDTDYVKEQKNYLKLKHEIEQEENVD
jgi:hypothetical protein